MPVKQGLLHNGAFFSKNGNKLGSPRFSAPIGGGLLSSNLSQLKALNPKSAPAATPAPARRKWMSPRVNNIVAEGVYDNPQYKVVDGKPDPAQLEQLISSLRAKQPAPQAASLSALPPSAPTATAQAQTVAPAPSIDADKMAKLKAFLGQLQGARANLPQPAAGAQQDPMSQLRALFSQMNTARMAQQQRPATAAAMPSQAPSASIMPQQISQPIPVSGVNPDALRKQWM